MRSIRQTYKADCVIRLTLDGIEIVLLGASGGADPASDVNTNHVWRTTPSAFIIRVAGLSVGMCGHLLC